MLRLERERLRTMALTSENSRHDAPINIQSPFDSFLDILNETLGHIQAKTSQITGDITWLCSLGSDLKNMMNGIFVTALATYQLVNNMQTASLGRAERSLYNEPVILDDPLGRLFPIPLDFIDCWEAFDDVLEIQFRSRQGHRLVEQGKYVLHESSANRDIDRRFPFNAELRSGQRLVMCMTFTDEPTGPGGCPGCGEPSSLEDIEVHWYDSFLSEE